MDLPTVLNLLNIRETDPAISPGWEESLQSRPSDGIFFLEKKFIQEGCDYIGLPPEAREMAIRAADRIRADPALSALAWHAHGRMYRGGKNIANWPPLAVLPGEDTGLFYFLALLSNHPQTRAFHEAHAIPAVIVAETMGDIFHHLEMNRKRTGHYGLAPLYAGGWLKHHFKGELFKLGRLQYMPCGFPKGYAVFRNRNDRRVIALAESGITFRRDGQKNGASGITETQGVWTSTLQTDDECFVGSPIDPINGVACREILRLSRADWEEILRPGDPVLDIHIPSTGPMTVADCAPSARQAVDFFKKYFPEKPAAKALICTSWLLDAQLAQWLKPDSNIMLFQRQFYLYPADCDPWAIFRFIFDLDIPYGQEGGVDLKKLPQKSSLEKAVVAHAEAGQRWRKAGGFLLVEDLPWGREVYRKQGGV